MARVTSVRDKDNFKHFYLEHVRKYWSHEFPKLPSYKRFVDFMSSVLMPLCIYLKHCFGQCTGISFVDSTCLHVCHNRRIAQHRVFKGMAARGKTTDKLLSRKRSIIEIVIDQLKNISQIEHGY